MKLIQTSIQDLVIIEPQVFGDERGYFFESHHDKKFADLGLSYRFVQDNESSSRYGTLRGLHFQRGDAAQAKLVRVVTGEVLDVAVDLRAGSPTYGQSETVVLSAENKRMLLVPRGFAHGFVVLSEQAIFQYKCDNFYDPKVESGIRWDDPALAIDWRVPRDRVILSPKDAVLPSFKDYRP
jgi:dTDP-4-dehydrorhamnose 3,5-epimerase